MKDALIVTFDGSKVYRQSDYVYGLNTLNSQMAPQFVINVTTEQQKNCKYFISREERNNWLYKRTLFIDYVESFYGKDGIYQHFFTPFLTRLDIIRATNAIDKAGQSKWLEHADSISREIVRDYIFISRAEDRKKINIEYTIVKEWF